MSSPFSNPELIRNARAQLRPGRMLVIALVCGVLSVVVTLSFLGGNERASDVAENALALFRGILGTQVLILALGGMLGCGQSIQREKQMNTFDFQRVTRLTPWELTLGKLFGATVLPWFIVLCFMPVALWAAITARVSPLLLLAAYVVMIVGSLTYHAGALLLSLSDAKDAGARLLGVFVLLGFMFMLIGFESSYAYPPPGGRLTPLFSLAVVDKQIWTVTPEQAACLARMKNPSECAVPMQDKFFGQLVNHYAVFLIVSMLFTAWFLLGVVRNIKRDPATYEIYSPLQSLGFAMFLNVLLLGFGTWGGKDPLGTQAAANIAEVTLFFLMAMVLLRNRDQVRRRLRRSGEGAVLWFEAAWPAPYLLVGMLAAGFAVIAMIAQSTSALGGWITWGNVAIFRVLYLTTWLVRDTLYFQWMGLRRGRRARALGFTYWMVYYTAFAILLPSLSLYNRPDVSPVLAIFEPWQVFSMELTDWAVGGWAWSVALVTQILAAGLFVALQRGRLSEIGATTPPPTAAPAPLPAGD